MPKNQWFFNHSKKDLSCFQTNLWIFTFLKNFIHCEQFGKATTLLPSKQPCCTRSEQDNYWQNVSTGIKILSSSVFYKNKRYQISSAGIYILWLYQYHDSAIHPQRNGLNLTEYLQHFIFCRHKLKRTFLSHRLRLFFCTLK